MTNNRFILWVLLCTSPTFRKWWSISIVLYAILGGPLVFWIGSVVDQNGSHGAAIMIALAVLCGYLWVVVGIAMWLAAVVIAWMYKTDYGIARTEQPGMAPAASR